MISKGVQIPDNSLRRERVVQFEFDKKRQEFTKNVMIVLACLGNESEALKWLEKYEELLFPGDDLKKKIEDNKDLLDQESKKEYTVQKIFNE